MIKIYRNRDWLWEHYIVQKESSYVMAKAAGCGDRAIRYWLHKLSISIRNRNNLWQDRDWLYEHYIVREESSYVMAREAKCDSMTIYYWLRKMEIPIRERSEGVFLATRNSVIITPDLLEFLEGEILGDGHVRIPGHYSTLYSHGSKYREYLIWLSGQFAEWGIEQVGKINRCKSKQNGVIYYCYASRSYPELVPIYRRWYPSGKKAVPKDLKLTPIMARQWYLGDGGFDNYKIKRPGIKLSTCDFDRQSIGYLLEELDRLGFKATHRADNTIRIWVRSVPDFLKWIGPCPISCYDYKWDYQKSA